MSDEQSGSSNLDDQLITACKNGSVKIIEELLDMGANINSLNKNGITPLMTAVKNNKTIAVDYLLKRGADVNQKNTYNYSALNIANTPEIVELLIQVGADLESRLNGETPLIRAVHSGDIWIVNILLDAGANIDTTVNDINSPYYNDFTPLMIAVNDGDYDMSVILIRRGANVNYETRDGKTMLMIACKNGLYRIAIILIENGAHVNYKNIDGRTALMFACMYASSYYHVDIIRLLLDKGADINIRDSVGYDVFDYISSGTKILRGIVKPFDIIGSSFRNEHMDEIIDMIINKVNRNVKTMEKTLRNRGLDKFAAQTIAIEHFDPRKLSVYAEVREENIFAKSKSRSKKGGKNKSKRMTRRNKH